jgi:hypothetical protein
LYYCFEFTFNPFNMSTLKNIHRLVSTVCTRLNFNETLVHFSINRLAIPFLLLPLLTQVPAFSQSLKIRGVITDQDSSEPIEYATISLYNSSVSTYSNASGAFELSVNAGDTLKVSSVGFKNKYTVARSAAPLTITMEREIISLDGVVVHADTIYKVVERAFKQIKKNYPRSKYYREAFFREYAKKDNSYVRLIEAAVSEFDNGFSSPHENQRIRIDEIRKSVDNIEKSWQTKVIEFVFGKSNSLVVSKYNGDFIRRYSQNRKLFLNDKLPFEEYYEFKHTGFTSYDGEQLYIVEISMPAKRDKGQFKGFMYINPKDYGIVRFAHAFGMPADFQQSSSANQQIAYRTYQTSYDAYYRKVGSKYYLSRIKSVIPAAIGTIDKENMTGFQFFHTDYVTVKLYTKKSQYDKVKKKESITRSMDLYDSKAPYNKDFWESYPVLLANPVDHQAIVELNPNF